MILKRAIIYKKPRMSERAILCEKPIFMERANGPK